MQNPIPSRRLACASLPGPKPVDRAVARLIEAGFASDSIRVLLPGEDSEEVHVEFRTGVRRALPVAVAIGAMLGVLLGYYDTTSNIPITARLVTGLATGGFLGGMAGIVLGLGHWDLVVDLPDDAGELESMIVAVELPSPERERVAMEALQGAGASSTKLCSEEEAWEFVESTAETSEPDAS